MDAARPIDVYRSSIFDLQQLVKEFRISSESSPMQHQLIVWEAPDTRATVEGWQTFLSEVGLLPFFVSRPDENAQCHFLPDDSRCNRFRWRGEPELLEIDFESLAGRAFRCLGTMRSVHAWCLPASECRVPKQFGLAIDPPFGMTYAWLQVLYECASEWHAVSDVPAWMPTTRQLVGKTAKAKLIECQDVWMLSAEAITRWLPSDVDDFMSAWKAPDVVIRKPAQDEQTLLLRDEKDYFPFLFRKVGGGWIIRFWTGDKVERAWIPEPQKGCSHYQKLLTSPGRPISAIELDPRKKPDPTDDTALSGRSIISEEESYQGSDDVKWDASLRRFYAPLVTDELIGLLEQKESLERQLDNESNETERQRLTELLKNTNKTINEQFRRTQDASPSGRAFRRVKKAMGDARRKMKAGETLPEFLDHLHRSFQEVGHGYLYDPKPRVTWET